MFVGTLTRNGDNTDYWYNEYIWLLRCVRELDLWDNRKVMEELERASLNARLGKEVL